MLFNSLAFMGFFPITTLGYFLLKPQHRWLWLLLASCVFYMAFIPKYLAILGITILIDYLAAICIEKAEGKERKNYLIISIVTTCLILFVFKYYNFFQESVVYLAKVIGWQYSLEALEIILPIGLSFHTFQSLSYVIEVYRGNQKAEKHFGIYALYVMFYPQLVAGPIERPQNLLHQFHNLPAFRSENVSKGINMMLWGLFKKIVIADQLAEIVEKVYAQPNLMPLAYVIGTVCFALQIYCDFSGYSEVAIGAAKVMGFELMTNFKLPYYSTSISEFWRRWHISLSTWFKDYVYIPLGGSQVAPYRKYLNLLITFLISGLWHGASWTFVVWGGLNGVLLIVEQVAKSLFTQYLKGKYFITDFIYKLGAWCCTFSLICMTWVFFRANNLPHAIAILRHIVKLPSISLKEQFAHFQQHIMAFDKNAMLLVASLCLFLIGDHFVQRNDFFAKTVFPLRWSFCYLILIWMLLFGKIENPPSFIYFQF
ncbi:MAG: MBOAT family O-acyltransferase [Bacteroidia bacterium]